MFNDELQKIQMMEDYKKNVVTLSSMFCAGRTALSHIEPFVMHWQRRTTK